MQKEIVVIRSSISKLLFDVVEVDYSEETVNYLGTGLDFESACETVANFEKSKRLETA